LLNLNTDYEKRWDDTTGIHATFHVLNRFFGGFQQRYSFIRQHEEQTSLFPISIIMNKSAFGEIMITDCKKQGIQVYFVLIPLKRVKIIDPKLD